eukprot:Skav202648  [mRNA]  locus=scaffold2784:107826:110098:+ [translate_table: standard]
MPKGSGGGSAAGLRCGEGMAPGDSWRTLRWLLLLSFLRPAASFIEEIFQQFAAGGGQQFHFQMGDGGAFEMGGGYAVCQLSTCQKLVEDHAGLLFESQKHTVSLYRREAA